MLCDADADVNPLKSMNTFIIQRLNPLISLTVLQRCLAARQGAQRQRTGWRQSLQLQHRLRFLPATADGINKHNWIRIASNVMDWERLIFDKYTLQALYSVHYWHIQFMQFTILLERTSNFFVSFVGLSKVWNYYYGSQIIIFIYANKIKQIKYNITTKKHIGNKMMWGWFVVIIIC